MGTKQSEEALMRKNMIESELQKFIKLAEEQELEEEMEKESADALKIAADKICYLKKYYNVMTDKVIYFPSLAKTIMQYDLFEEAEKHYFEEEDEFPMEYSAALRSVAVEAFDQEDENDGGHDDEMMDRLSMNLVLTQQEQDELNEATALAEAEDAKAKAEAELEPTQPAAKNSEPRLLLLISKSSIGNREQLASQDLVITMLQSQGLEPEIVDGADAKNKDRRNELFRISNLRAKYPQLFVVQNENDEPTFVGDFDTIQEMNETGQLTESYLLAEKAEEGAVAAPAVVPAFEPHLLLLISKLSTNPQQTANQDMVMTMIKTNGFDEPEILDGSDLQLKDRRNELFRISNLRAKYPQLFVIKTENDEPTFVGDFDTIQDMNEMGQLTRKSVLGIEETKLANEEPAAAEEKKAPIIENNEIVKPKSMSMENQEIQEPEVGGPNLLLLISNISGNRQQDANQAWVLSTLQQKGLKPMLLDGADPQNKTRRNQLFELSGMRARYPQLFLESNDKTKKTKFIGDYDAVKALEETGELVKTIASTKTMLAKQNADEKKKLVVVVGAGVAGVVAILVGYFLAIRKN